MYSVIQEAWNIQACKYSGIGVHSTRGDTLLPRRFESLLDSSDATHE